MGHLFPDQISIKGNVGICCDLGLCWFPSLARLLPPFDPDFPAIAAAGQSLDIMRFFGGITQHLAQSVYGRTNTVFEFDNGPVRPEGISNLLPGHEVPGAFEQHGEDSKWLLCESD